MPRPFNTLRYAWWQLRHKRRIILRHGTRSFTLTVPRNPGNLVQGRLVPRPELHGTRAGTTRKVETSAYLDFTIIRNRIGKFQGIGVPDEHHRQGWASDMVRALLNYYPHVHFFNSSVNDMSGPLFIKLRAETPGRIAPLRIHADGGYEVDTTWRPEPRQRGLPPVQNHPE